MTLVQILSLVFAVTGIAYIASIHKLPWKGDFVLKSIPALTLAVMALLFIPGTTGILLFLGFVFSAGGDIFLSFEGEKFFLGGLSSFLVAHVMYVIAFAQQFEYDGAKLPFLIAVGVFGVIMAVILTPKLGPMKIPVYAYISVILTMGVFATLCTGAQQYTLLDGAALFIISDSLIAVNKFLKPIPGSKYYIMSTYYAGQFLIAKAFIVAPLF